MAITRRVGSEDKPNRKQRNGLPRQIWTENPGLDVVHPHAAGIDVGSSEHYVAIAADKAGEPVQRFNCFTSDLRRLAAFLKAHGIRSVAMQSTGVYWIPLYDVLEEEGFEVYLVNARDTKNLPGTQDRRARESVVAQTTYVWTAAKFVPSYIRNPHITHVLAAKSRTRTGCQRVRQPHAEVPDANEPAIGECY